MYAWDAGKHHFTILQGFSKELSGSPPDAIPSEGKDISQSLVASNRAGAPEIWRVGTHIIKCGLYEMFSSGNECPTVKGQNEIPKIFSLAITSEKIIPN